MNKSSDGEWPDWWRHVSLLYGQELALNDEVDDLAERWLIKGDHLDVESCRNTPVTVNFRLISFKVKQKVKFTIKD